MRRHRRRRPFQRLVDVRLGVGSGHVPDPPAGHPDPVLDERPGEGGISGEVEVLQGGVIGDGTPPEPDVEGHRQTLYVHLDSVVGGEVPQPRLEASPQLFQALVGGIVGQALDRGDGGRACHHRGVERPRVIDPGRPEALHQLLFARQRGDRPSSGQGLPNNAGGDPFIKPWPHQTPDDWRGTYEVNVVASMRLIHLLSPKMAERGYGRIINVSSIYGSLGQDPRNATSRGGAGAYTAAKHGVIGLTHYVACQLGRSGITVNTLSPGMIPWSKTTEEGEAVRARTADHTPVGRNGTPEDFVTAVVFLSSEGSGFVNGANIVVDGGWSIW